MSEGIRNRIPEGKKKEETSSPAVAPVVVESPEQRWSKIKTRSILGIFMILAFVLILNSNHYVIAAFVFILQVMGFREILQVRYKEAKEKKLWMYRSLQWFMYFGTFYWLDFPKAFPHIRSAFPFAQVLLDYHLAICFGIYVTAFVLFILQLRGKVLKYQLGQLTWTLMTILLVQQSSFAIRNALNGIIWLVLPSILIISNDCMAYFCGLSFGRKFIKRNLFSLSPSKTWEGFIGAFIFTTIFGFFIAGQLAQSQWLICPKVTGIFDEGFLYSLKCVPDPVFLPTTYYLPSFFSNIVGFSSVVLRPIQFHAIIFSIFASLIAPFGGFFASAIKRAYKIKDFDSLFPGHGGIMDRMDCQLIMALFTYVYYTTFINNQPHVTPETVLNLISRLPLPDQFKILQHLNATVGKQ